MTTDVSAQPPAQPPGALPPGEPGQQPPPDAPQPKRRRGRLLLKTLAWMVAVLVLLVAVVIGLVYGALTTERGTAYAWQAAVKLLGGKLTGTLESGAIAHGVQLRQVRWRSLDGSGTDIQIDRVAGRWELTHKPWRFAIDYLHVGTIDARVGSSSSSSSGPLKLPQDLRLPMQLEVRDVQVDKLLLREGGSTTELSRFMFHGRSDGRHHEAAIERLDTPFGAVTATAKLDGVRPFPLTGDLGYSGKVNNEAVQVGGHLSGSLENLIAELDASGMKLAGHARVEATPFGDVPLQRATLTFDHVNPQAFAPGAPLADLAVRAELQPVGQAAAGVAAKAAAGFAVAGHVSIVNAKPGAIDQNLLPVIDANADVRLDAQAQRISNLKVRLEKSATLTGGGALTGKRGQFDLQVAGLDLNALEATVRPTQLSGPIGIRLNDDVQSLTLDLADPKAGLRAQGKVTFDPARMSFNDVRVTSGKGRIDLSGALKHDANSTYNLKAQLTDFDPLTLTSQMPSRTPATPTAGTAKATKAPQATKPEAAQANEAAALAGSTAGAKSAAPGDKAAAVVKNTAKAVVKAEVVQRKVPPRPSKAPPARKIEARVNGTLTAAGMLGPVFSTKAEFKLGPSVYDGLPLTGGGVVQLSGSRILPSRANLSVAGNQVDLQGSFGARGDRLRFRVDAPELERLGFGLAGLIAADGDVTGSFAHPNVVLNYKADSVVFSSNRIGHAEGHAELRDGANGALVFTTDARNVSAGGVDLTTLTARLSGTRANHTLEAAATGKLQDRPLDLTLAANGKLTEARDGTRWDGTVTRLQNRGTPALNLESPLAVSAGPNHLTLGATRLTLEGAVLSLKSFAFDHGKIQSAGTLTDISLVRLQDLRRQITGEPPAVKTDLMFDGDWDFALGSTASGHVQLKRRSGDVTVEIGRGLASLGITDMSARAEFSGGNRLNATVHAQASRIGVVDADAHTTLVMRDGFLTVNEEGAVSGNVNANVPSLKTTGGLFGPSYLLDGHLALKLALGGTVAKPNLTGSLLGDGLSATMVDQGVQLKDGVVRIALSQNLVDFQQVEFHGASGTLRATGRVRLDGAQPDLTASIVADKLELFAAPDRNLSLSGSASVANAGAEGGMAINGKFVVDHALFDMPEQSAPKLGDDVVVVRPDGTVAGERPPPQVAGTNKPIGPFAPRANIDISLGNSFRFRGMGADLGLTGTITAMSAPNLPLRAVGNVRVTQGSTYTAFGRKLNIENGFFTFNGPVANPGINILAMRRNQQVEAGVQVTGTVQFPVAKLVSEPNVADNEKLSWLLFGHGTDQGNNLGQQSTMTTALALLGSASGKRIAQTFGLDEFSIGRSEVGLTDPQVVMVSKAINEWLVVGYEQGLQSASNAIKATVNLTRYWSVAAYGGTFDGIELLYTRRFDRVRW
ncbi:MULTISPECIES: translocation/assembly module TamB domain-containing protein [Paraburkholderia]|uniref:Translocation/assembly module TamB domain-containing protein n=1 Tax=Paraburkholderia madseniana TaxID=2599607 RepID=A0AAP5BI68_9BURK|nr:MULTISPECIES: translocation/assembly module TamB domain-containing protein [Paraburkholderia]MCX4149120.1 translocation/assembly module TamB domain-containing protein [Paraburkholderia madseniana]MDN7152057.1 translocation/assembly module TamB domain-containing protein [Paraburkholderia sp. WS6]MDQ6410937.1 translocation/assembly module TamB domain-containing protein [Paraburkholderia madseniana]